MQKRGAMLPLKPVIEMLVAAIVIAALMTIGGAYGSQEIFQKARVVREAALMVNSLQALPGNGWITFPDDVSSYSFDFFENQVKVFRDRTEATAVPYRHVTRSDFEKQSIDKPEKIYLSMAGGEFKVGDKPGNMAKYQCENSNKDFLSQQINFEIEQIIPEDLIINKINIELIKKIINKINIELIKKTGIGCRGCTDIGPLDTETVYIKLKSGEKDKFKAYFYYDSEESKNLGCVILNKVLDEYPEARVSLIPSDELENKKDKTNLILSLGDTNSEKLGLVIAKSLEAYYE